LAAVTLRAGANMRMVACATKRAGPMQRKRQVGFTRPHCAGKQTAALFSALSARTTFAYNVAYNGPRAAINLNDAYGHGHVIESNLLFNWVRETQVGDACRPYAPCASL
jgi:hypothetical protein